MTPLERFVLYVETNLSRVKSLADFTPALTTLGQDRSWLKEYLKKHLNNFEVQDILRGAITVARGAHFRVRVCNWHPSDQSFGNYAPEAHNHTFELLTFGLRGPGYTTDLYKCDPEQLLTAEIADVVTCEMLESTQLHEGRVLHYTPYVLAHEQHPPLAHSMSLNLMVEVDNPRKYQQSFIEPKTCRLLRRVE